MSKEVTISTDDINCAKEQTSYLIKQFHEETRPLEKFACGFAASRLAQTFKNVFRYTAVYPDFVLLCLETEELIEHARINF